MALLRTSTMLWRKSGTKRAIFFTFRARRRWRWRGCTQSMATEDISLRRSARWTLSPAGTTFFVGDFFYGEEHWTCIAAEAIYPAVSKRSYLDFCLGYAEFLRRQQLVASDFVDHVDLAGSYGFTPFVSPQNTPAGSRSEAVISTYALSLHHGRADPVLREQIAAAMRYLLAQQVREANSWWIPSSAEAEGAFPAGPIDRTVRIDYVQHCASAMIRSAALFASEWRHPTARDRRAGYSAQRGFLSHC